MENTLTIDYSAKEDSLSYMGISLGSVLLSAGLALARKRMGMFSFLGVIAPAILLYGMSRRLSKLEAAQATEKIIH